MSCTKGGDVEIKAGIMININYSSKSIIRESDKLHKKYWALFSLEHSFIRIFYLSTFFILTFLLIPECFAQKPLQPFVKPNEVTKDIQALLNYSGKHLRFKQNFVAYDQRMGLMSKEGFIKQLISGKYLPLRLKADDNKFVYKLYELPANTHTDIGRMVKQIAETNYGFLQIEGKVMPAFKFVDIKGNVYTPENTKGKIIALKAWFLSCVPCIEEMPALNKLKEKYAKRKDILFLSIAFDPKEKLVAFSKSNSFNYAIIPMSAQFIEQKLMATGYPAHWVINKKGIVVNMSYDKNSMIAALKTEAQR